MLKVRILDFFDRLGWKASMHACKHNSQELVSIMATVLILADYVYDSLNPSQLSHLLLELQLP